MQVCLPMDQQAVTSCILARGPLAARAAAGSSWLLHKPGLLPVQARPHSQWCAGALFLSSCPQGLELTVTAKACLGSGHWGHRLRMNAAYELCVCVCGRPLVALAAIAAAELFRS